MIWDVGEERKKRKWTRRKPLSERKPYTRKNPSAPNQNQKVDMTMVAALFAYGKDEHGRPMTLQEMGDILGVTRERVRQIRATKFTWLPSTAEERNPINERLARERKFRKHLWAWRFTVCEWLLAEEYAWCSRCMAVKCIAEMANGWKRRHIPFCKECSATRMRHRYQTNPKAREYCREYNRSPKAKAYFAEYNRTHPPSREEYSEKAKSSPHAIKCVLCERVVRGFIHDRSKPHKHQTLDGQPCEGHKQKGLPLEKPE